MRPLDWVVLIGTLALIVIYGTWKTRSVKTIDGYLRGGSDAKWFTIGLAVMATQASAITFLSTPGQAYEEGMGFLQFYFGVPIAMVLLSATIVPLYYRLKVFTAYEYLESRFDLKTRLLTAVIFLLSRGLGAGISIYAPAIIFSAVLGWPLRVTTFAIGIVVILYTVSGGTRAVNQTQTYQMIVMLGGMALAAILILKQLPSDVSFQDAVGIAGTLGKLKVVDYSFRLDTRYTFWAGLTGGLFVQLAYFGTDQSQVQRYLSGESLKESRLGLLFNGLVKVPMQFLILFVGVIVFVFYQFHRPPIFFNQVELDRLERSVSAKRELSQYLDQFANAFVEKEQAIAEFLRTEHTEKNQSASAGERLRSIENRMVSIRNSVRQLIAKENPRSDTKDTDYIFIRFVTEQLPVGVVGLLIAVILCAAMSATAAALNALGTSSMVDFYKRVINPKGSDAQYLFWAKLFTVFWGTGAVLFATFASQIENLIQAVNIIGSIFYGPMLGVFIVGFFLKRVGGTAVFWATVVSQLIVILVFIFSSIGFLWYNVVGCTTVVALSLLGSTWNLRRPALA